MNRFLIATAFLSGILFGTVFGLVMADHIDARTVAHQVLPK